MAHERHDPLVHVNNDHADELLLAVRTLGSRPEATAARATSIDREGVEVDIDAPGGATTVRLTFDEPIPEAEFPDGFRVAFIRMLRRAKNASDT